MPWSRVSGTLDKEGTAKTPSRNGFLLVRYLPILLYFVCAALCSVWMWGFGENLIPYPLTIDLSAVLLLTGVLSSGAPSE